MGTKINRKRLEEALAGAVKSTVSKIFESSQFSALRSIEHLAASTAMDFEKNILDSLGLEHPDKMPPEVQEKYLHIVNAMRDDMRNVIVGTARKLISFPRQAEKQKD